MGTCESCGVQLPVHDLVEYHAMGGGRHDLCFDCHAAVATPEFDALNRRRDG